MRVAAQLPIGGGADGSAATVATSGAALLECQQLLGAEGLVVDLGGRLDQILKVGAGQEVSQVDELAVVLVLDVDDSPPVLAAADLLAVDDDGLLRADNGEGNDVLTVMAVSHRSCHKSCVHGAWYRSVHYLDLGVDRTLLIVELVVVVGVHLQVVEGKLLLDALLESLALLEGQRVGLGDDGDDVDNVGQLLQDDNIDGLERVAGGLDEEQAAVDAGVLDVALSLGGELLAEVCRVLVLDVLDDGVPADPY